MSESNPVALSGKQQVVQASTQVTNEAAQRILREFDERGLIKKLFDGAEEDLTAPKFDGSGYRYDRDRRLAEKAHEERRRSARDFLKDMLKTAIASESKTEQTNMTQQLLANVSQVQGLSREERQMVRQALVLLQSKGEEEDDGDLESDG